MWVWASILVLSGVSFVPLYRRMLNEGTAGVAPRMLWCGFLQGVLLTSVNLAQHRPDAAAMFATIMLGFTGALVIFQKQRAQNHVSVMIGLAMFGLPFVSPTWCMPLSMLGLSFSLVRLLPQILHTLRTRTAAGLSPWFFFANMMATSLALSVELSQHSPSYANVANFSLVLFANSLQLGSLLYTRLASARVESAPLVVVSAAPRLIGAATAPALALSGRELAPLVGAAVAPTRTLEVAPHHSLAS